MMEDPDDDCTMASLDLYMETLERDHVGEEAKDWAFRVFSPDVKSTASSFDLYSDLDDYNIPERMNSGPLSTEDTTKSRDKTVDGVFEESACDGFSETVPGGEEAGSTKAAGAETTPACARTDSEVTANARKDHPDSNSLRDSQQIRDIDWWKTAYSELQKEYKELEEKYATVNMNMRSLILTARTEIKKKDALISKLRKALVEAKSQLTAHTCVASHPCEASVSTPDSGTANDKGDGNAGDMLMTQESKMGNGKAKVAGDDKKILSLPDVQQVSCGTSPQRQSPLGSQSPDSTTQSPPELTASQRSVYRSQSLELQEGNVQPESSEQPETKKCIKTSPVADNPQGSQLPETSPVAGNLQGSQLPEATIQEVNLQTVLADLSTLPKNLQTSVNLQQEPQNENSSKEAPRADKLPVSFHDLLPKSSSALLDRPGSVDLQMSDVEKIPVTSPSPDLAHFSPSHQVPQVSPDLLQKQSYPESGDGPESHQVQQMTQPPEERQRSASGDSQTSVQSWGSAECPKTPNPYISPCKLMNGQTVASGSESSARTPVHDGSCSPGLPGHPDSSHDSSGMSASTPPKTPGSSPVLGKCQDELLAQSYEQVPYHLADSVVMPEASQQNQPSDESQLMSAAHSSQDVVSSDLQEVQADDFTKGNGGVPECSGRRSMDFETEPGLCCCSTETQKIYCVDADTDSQGKRTGRNFFKHSDQNTSTNVKDSHELMHEAAETAIAVKQPLQPSHVIKDVPEKTSSKPHQLPNVQLPVPVPEHVRSQSASAMSPDVHMDALRYNADHGDRGLPCTLPEDPVMSMSSGASVGEEGNSESKLQTVDRVYSVPVTPRSSPFLQHIKGREWRAKLKPWPQGVFEVVRHPRPKLGHQTIIVHTSWNSTVTRVREGRTDGTVPTQRARSDSSGSDRSSINSANDGITTSIPCWSQGTKTQAVSFDMPCHKALDQGSSVLSPAQKSGEQNDANLDNPRHHIPPSIQLSGGQYAMKRNNPPMLTPPSAQLCGGQCEHNRLKPKHDMASAENPAALVTKHGNHDSLIVNKNTAQVVTNTSSVTGSHTTILHSITKEGSGESEKSLTADSSDKDNTKNDSEWENDTPVIQKISVPVKDKAEKQKREKKKKEKKDKKKDKKDKDKIQKKGKDGDKVKEKKQRDENDQEMREIPEQVKNDKPCSRDVAMSGAEITVAAIDREHSHCSKETTGPGDPGLHEGLTVAERDRDGDGVLSESKENQSQESDMHGQTHSSQKEITDSDYVTSEMGVKEVLAKLSPQRDGSDSWGARKLIGHNSPQAYRAKKILRQSSEENAGEKDDLEKSSGSTQSLVQQFQNLTPSLSETLPHPVLVPESKTSTEKGTCKGVQSKTAALTLGEKRRKDSNLKRKDVSDENKTSNKEPAEPADAGFTSHITEDSRFDFSIHTDDSESDVSPEKGRGGYSAIRNLSFLRHQLTDGYDTTDVSDNELQSRAQRTKRSTLLASVSECDVDEKRPHRVNPTVHGMRGQSSIGTGITTNLPASEPVTTEEKHSKTGAENSTHRVYDLPESNCKGKMVFENKSPDKDTGRDGQDTVAPMLPAEVSTPMKQDSNVCSQENESGLESPAAKQSLSLFGSIEVSPVRTHSTGLNLSLSSSSDSSVETDPKKSNIVAKRAVLPSLLWSPDKSLMSRLNVEKPMTSHSYNAFLGLSECSLTVDNSSMVPMLSAGDSCTKDNAVLVAPFQGSLSTGIGKKVDGPEASATIPTSPAPSNVDTGISECDTKEDEDSRSSRPFEFNSPLFGYPAHSVKLRGGSNFRYQQKHAPFESSSSTSLSSATTSGCVSSTSTSASTSATSLSSQTPQKPAAVSHAGKMGRVRRHSLGFDVMAHAPEDAEALVGHPDECADDDDAFAGSDSGNRGRESSASVQSPHETALLENTAAACETASACVSQKAAVLSPHASSPRHVPHTGELEDGELENTSTMMQAFVSHPPELPHAAADQGALGPSVTRQCTAPLVLDLVDQTLEEGEVRTSDGFPVQSDTHNKLLAAITSPPQVLESVVGDNAQFRDLKASQQKMPQDFNTEIAQHRSSAAYTHSETAQNVRPLVAEATAELLDENDDHVHHNYDLETEKQLYVPRSKKMKRKFLDSEDIPPSKKKKDSPKSSPSDSKQSVSAASLVSNISVSDISSTQKTMPGTAAQREPYRHSSQTEESPCAMAGAAVDPYDTDDVCVDGSELTDQEEADTERCMSETESEPQGSARTRVYWKLIKNDESDNQEDNVDEDEPELPPCSPHSYHASDDESEKMYEAGEEGDGADGPEQDNCQDMSDQEEENHSDYEAGGDSASDSEEQASDSDENSDEPEESGEECETELTADRSKKYRDSFSSHSHSGREQSVSENDEDCGNGSENEDQGDDLGSGSDDNDGVFDKGGNDRCRNEVLRARFVSCSVASSSGRELSEGECEDSSHMSESEGDNIAAVRKSERERARSSVESYSENLPASPRKGNADNQPSWSVDCLSLDAENMSLLGSHTDVPVHTPDGGRHFAVVSHHGSETQKMRSASHQGSKNTEGLSSTVVERLRKLSESSELSGCQDNPSCSSDKPSPRNLGKGRSTDRHRGRERKSGKSRKTDKAKETSHRENSHKSRRSAERRRHSKRSLRSHSHSLSRSRSRSHSRSCSRERLKARGRSGDGKRSHNRSAHSRSRSRSRSYSQERHRSAGSSHGARGPQRQNKPRGSQQRSASDNRNQQKPFNGKKRGGRNLARAPARELAFRPRPRSQTQPCPCCVSRIPDDRHPQSPRRDERDSLRERPGPGHSRRVSPPSHPSDYRPRSSEEHHSERRRSNEKDKEGRRSSERGGHHKEGRRSSEKEDNRNARHRSTEKEGYHISRSRSGDREAHRRPSECSPGCQGCSNKSRSHSGKRESKDQKPRDKSPSQECKRRYRERSPQSQESNHRDRSPSARGHRQIQGEQRRSSTDHKKSCPCCTKTQKARSRSRSVSPDRPSRGRGHRRDRRSSKHRNSRSLSRSRSRSRSKSPVKRRHEKRR